MMLRSAPIIALAALLGCGGGSTSSDAAIAPLDGAPAPADAAVASDGIPPLLWVDFAISGCTSGGGDIDPDAGAIDPCVGTAPLELSFAAVSPASIDVYQWSFGDSGDSDVAAPSHIYTTPGSFDVSLVVGGPGGTATADKPAIITVEAAPLGARCTLDSQCQEDLTCLCNAEATCPAALDPGFCSQPCSEASCPAGVCADLAPTSPDSPAVWQTQLCLPDCADNPCGNGLPCRELAAGSSEGWVMGCFAGGVLADIGQSCRDEDGATDDSRCSSGSCWDEGARGLCSDSCDSATCPPSAACATFTAAGLGARCIARCEAASDCSDDPWLACEAPGGSGEKSFTVAESAATLGYCAPKSCTDGGECGDDGDCIDGFCGPAT
jgi:PKD repeat protein